LINYAIAIPFTWL